MKHILLLCSLLLAGISSAQTTAQDWQKSDCDGNTYGLFDMCDSGDVVVMEFIMMNCSPCVTAANLMKTAVEEIEQTHPGKVKVFSISFNNTTTCNVLRTWKTNAGCTWPVVANGKDILEYYGGQMAMPTVIVVGGADKKVIFNSLDESDGRAGFIEADVAAFKTAITNSLTQSSVKQEKIVEGGFVISPNPASYSMSIHTSAMMHASSYRIIDMKGNTVLEGRYDDSRDGNLQQRSGSSDPIVISTLPSGAYTVLLTLVDGKVHTSQFTVAR
ncbi:MAG TPA: T9SS type A sorting domain-containing protein [Candidatus Kapabacteria bacterium]